MWTGHWMHGEHWGLSMWGMGLFWMLLLVLLLVVVFRRGAEADTRRGPPSHDETPLEILQRRYARGEIDRAEFEQRRRDLTS